MLEVLQNISCREDANVGRSFEQVIGTNVTVTDYPKRFDWNIDSVLDWNKWNCSVIKDNSCEIQRHDGVRMQLL